MENIDELAMSERVALLRKNLEERYHKACRNELYEAAYAENAAESNVVKIAKGFEKFILNKPIVLDEYDVLAGHFQFDNYLSSLPFQMCGEIDPRYNAECYFDIPREVEEYLSAAILARDSKEGKMLDYFISGIKIGLYKRWGSGHVCPGYEIIINKGLDDIIRRIENVMEKAEGECMDQYRAMLTCSLAMQKYILRYAQKARDIITSGSSKYNAGIQKIAETCEWIAYNKPKDFFGAVQLLWFAHEMTLWENLPGSISFGRLDQYLYPFFRKDIEENKITMEEAQEIIDALWLKIGLVVEAFQNVVVGGGAMNKTSACNELSILCLRASRKFKADQPAITSRYDNNTPDWYWDECLKLIRTGIGFPAIYNDDVAIPAKESLGVSKSDAVNYGIVGCAEPTIPGKEYSNTEELRYNWAKVLELALNNGKDMKNGICIPLKNPIDLNSLKSFEKFYTWIKGEFENYLRIGIECIDMLDTHYYKNYPNPFLSCIVDNCIEKGKDVTNGGAIYNFSTVNTCGNANLADSIMAIKDIVFDKKLISLSEFSNVLCNNYIGHDELRAAAKKAPKYGNDLDEVDEIIKDLTDLFFKTLSEYINCKGQPFQGGLYTVYDHGRLGEKTVALPDGRLDGTSLSNSLSPSQGGDKSGPTALINSVVKMNHRKAANGVVLDLKFIPSFFEKDTHKKAFRELMEAYFEQGGMEVQFNCIDKETLLDAKKNPDKYKNLVVRVSGYSAYFTTLRESLQNEIIERTEYSAV